MKNWISKIFRQSEYRPKSDSKFADVLADRKQLLIKQIKIQIDKANLYAPLVPREFVRHCKRLFGDHLDDIAEKVVNSELRGSTQNYGYQDTKSGVYMVVSIMPWTTEEAIRKLSEMSDEKPFGYVNMMTKIFINNWPSPELTHFFHILLCLGDNTLYMHTAMGDYGGFPKAPREFTVFPVELLNNEERRMTGL